MLRWWKFVDKTAELAPDLSQLCLVTAAALADIDGDKDMDVVAACEWGWHSGIKERRR